MGWDGCKKGMERGVVLQESMIVLSILGGMGRRKKNGEEMEGKGRQGKARANSSPKRLRSVTVGLSRLRV